MNCFNKMDDVVMPCEPPRTAHDRIIAINGIQEKTAAMLVDLLKTVNGSDIGLKADQTDTCMIDALERVEKSAEQICCAVDALRMAIG